MIFLFAPFSLCWHLFGVILIQHGVMVPNATDGIDLLWVVAGVVLVTKVRRSDEKTASLGLITNLILMSCWPILFHLGMWPAASEFQRVQHAWPQMMADDPKYLSGNISPKFDALYNYADNFSGLGIFWMILGFVLFLVSWRRLHLFWRCLLPMLVGFWIVVFITDPGGLFAWVLD